MMSDAACSTARCLSSAARCWAGSFFLVHQFARLLPDYTAVVCQGYDDGKDSLSSDKRHLRSRRHKCQGDDKESSLEQYISGKNFLESREF